MVTPQKAERELLRCSKCQMVLGVKNGNFFTIRRNQKGGLSDVEIEIQHSEGVINVKCVKCHGQGPIFITLKAPKPTKLAKKKASVV